MIYEVFRQERKGQPFQHAGSVEAPNREFADVYARDYRARLNGKRVELAGITHGAVGLPAASGMLNGYASMRGTLAQPLGAVRLAAHDVVVGAQPIGNASEESSS